MAVTYRRAGDDGPGSGDLSLAAYGTGGDELNNASCT